MIHLIKKLSQGRNNIRLYMAFYIWLLTVSAHAIQLDIPATGLQDTPNTKTSPINIPPLIWHNDLDTAIALASTEYKPVLLLFSSTSCSWCKRLKNEVISDPDIQKLLQHFVLTDIDTEKDPGTASAYQINGIPTIIILSSDGRPQNGVNGFINKQDMNKLLRESLNPNILPPENEKFITLLSNLASNNITEEICSNAALAMGNKKYRQKIIEQIYSMTPQPRMMLARLLQNPRLAIRLGALELLEELSNKSFCYDPWNYTDDKISDGASNWLAWAANTNIQSTAIYTSLTPKQVKSYLTDLISGNRQRSLRAMQMLESGGPGIIEIITTFQNNHKSLPAGTKMMIQEAKYMLQIPVSARIDPSQTAHRLVFGNLDMKLKSINQLKNIGPAAVPILEEFLQSPDAIVRETTIDTLNSIKAPEILGIIEAHLKTETDDDVIYSAIRGLGQTKKQKSLNILISYLTNPNEELIIAALGSITKLKTKKAKEEIKLCLSDHRWRVRTAALNAIAKLKLTSLAEDITPLLNDSDSFVKFTAVKTISAISAKQAKTKLKEIFKTDDTLKAPIVAAFCNMDIPLPKIFANQLDKCNSEIIIAVINAMEDCEATDLWLIDSFISDKNNDVAYSAIRLIAHNGMTIGKYRKILIDIFSSSDSKKIIAAMESFHLDSDTKNEIRTIFPEWFELSSVSPSSPADNKALDDLLGAFEDNSQDTASKQTPETKKTNTGKTPGLSDLMSFFTEDTDTNQSEKSSASFRQLIEAIKKLLTAGDNTSISAAIILADLGCPDAIPVISKKLTSRTIKERKRIAESMSGIESAVTLPVLKILLKDDVEEVRKPAAEACLKNASKKPFIDALYTELIKPGSRLKPHEIYSYKLNSITQNYSGSHNMHRMATDILQNSTNNEDKILALIIIEKTWQRKDTKYTEPLLDDDSPFVRRAAFHAQGKKNRKNIDKYIDKISTDPSEIVRIVLPNLYMKSSDTWIHYFNKDNFSRSYDWYSSSSRIRMKPHIKQVITNLTTDPSIKIQVESYFCLLSNQQSFNISGFITAVESLPDNTTVKRRISEYLINNYKKLGPGFSALMPYLDERGNDIKTIKKIKHHLKLDTENNAENKPLYKSRKTDTLPVQATFIDVATKQKETDIILPTKIIYFYSPGCSDCERVEKLLEELKENRNNIEIERFNIKKIKSMRLNEALCERFQVPDKIRLVAPALFFHSGSLIKSDITLAGLEHLSSIPVTDNDWYQIEESNLETADTAINERYLQISFWIIALAGLLDGVNPCAFATIIFLLSYLQVTKRNYRQVLIVGTAFVTGVFITYFALGLGLIEIISKITFLKYVSFIINIIIAVFILIVMILNIRDGILCMQGHITDMTLQLPGNIKKRIHTVIRTGTKSSHIIIASFLIGIFISVLELACTGQVYAPTILYMMKTEHNTGAIFYLLIYNIAFVIPLIIIFILASLGLRSETLSKLMHRHAAAVKFGTAGLFLILLLVFIFELIK